MSRLSKIDSESKREYPKIGEPVTSVGLDWEKNIITRYLPHIITSKTEGFYLNYWVENYERAWELSMQKVGEMRRFGKNLTLF